MWECNSKLNSFRSRTDDNHVWIMNIMIRMCLQGSSVIYYFKEITCSNVCTKDISASGFHYLAFTQQNENDQRFSSGCVNCLLFGKKFVFNLRGVCIVAKIEMFGAFNSCLGARQRDPIYQVSFVFPPWFIVVVWLLNCRMQINECTGNRPEFPLLHWYNSSFSVRHWFSFLACTHTLLHRFLCAIVCAKMLQKDISILFSFFLLSLFSGGDIENKHITKCRWQKKASFLWKRTFSHSLSHRTLISHLSPRAVDLIKSIKRICVPSWTDHGVDTGPSARKW